MPAGLFVHEGNQLDLPTCASPRVPLHGDVEVTAVKGRGGAADPELAELNRTIGVGLHVCHKPSADKPEVPAIGSAEQLRAGRGRGEEGQNPIRAKDTVRVDAVVVLLSG